MFLKPNYKVLGVIFLLLFFLLPYSVVDAKKKKKVLDPVVKLSIELQQPEADPLKGDIFISLFAEKSPLSVKNFLDYARDGFYDGLIFHRLLDDFVLQGGGYDQNFNLKPTLSPIKNESLNKLSNQKWTLAMARSNKIHSATSQFFINLENNSFLDHQGTSQGQYGYAVFGKVFEGQSFLKEIIETPVIRKGLHHYVPVYDIVITKVTILQDLPGNKIPTPETKISVPTLKRKGTSSQKSLPKPVLLAPTPNQETIPIKTTSNSVITPNKSVTMNLVSTTNVDIKQTATKNSLTIPSLNINESGISSPNVTSNAYPLQKKSGSVSENLKSIKSITTSTPNSTKVTE